MRTLLAAALLVAALCAPAALATYPTEPERPPCGVATDPACWAPRMACQVYEPFVGGTPLEDCRNLSEPLAETATVNADILNTANDTTCENFGVIIMVTGTGENHYCVGGECENSGVIVMVGYSESCYGQGYGTVCVARTCVVGPDGVKEVSTLRAPAGLLA